ncbi:MAG: patatin-like phospholipase family protein [Micromonosporaceae bacterium]
MREGRSSPAGTDGRTGAKTAFVLGGGANLGAHEVGMLRALFEAGIRPDLVVGTSVGAVNAALVAAHPGPAAADELEKVWNGLGRYGVFGASLLDRVATAVRSGTHLYSNRPLRDLLEASVPVGRIEDLRLPFQCVAASIERAADHWFTEGPLIDAVLASCAVPGLLPPVEIGGEHFLDGGLVDSIPVGRAVALGARTIYVLQVGRIERALAVPRRPWEVAAVAFEIARRHRYVRSMNDLPDHVTVHVLPTGTPSPDYADIRQHLQYRNASLTRSRIDAAYRASARYLSTLVNTPPEPGAA